jgi:hypothetical protein
MLPYIRHPISLLVEQLYFADMNEEIRNSLLN